MKVLLSLFLVLTFTLSVSQTNSSNIKVNLHVSPLYEKITVTLQSEKETLDHCKVQILDSKKNIVKMVDLPKAEQLLEKSIPILDLAPGNYTCLVYKGEKELYKKDFLKDAILVEPQAEPVIYRSPN